MEIRKRLGSGGFAEVFEGFYQGQSVAVKRMKSTTKNPTATQEAFKAEARVLGLNHPHIIRLLVAEPDLIIMEFIPEAQTLQSLIDQEFTYPWRKYAQQLIEAAGYLHQHNILHLDIKPDNVLVDTKHQCKLIDFGCSQRRSEPVLSACQGTHAYRAPELFRGSLPTVKADIYSLGITFWSMKHQQRPYNGQNNDVIIYQVVAFQRRPSPDPEFQTMWDANPNQRPEAVQLKF